MMENIFNQEKLEEFTGTLQSKASAISPNTFICAGAGSLFLGAALKLAGKKQASSFFGKWAIPLLAIGCYKKYYNSTFAEDDEELQKNSPEDQNIVV